MHYLFRLAGGWLLALTLAIGPLAAASDLEQQLDIRPHNATAGAARDVADQWMRLGQRQAAMGERVQALSAWGQAADIYRALGDVAAEAEAYSHISQTYTDLGRYLEAEAVVRRQLAIARDNADLSSAVASLNQLGLLLVQQNRRLEAETAFTEALAIAEAIPSPSGIGAALSNLGQIAVFKGDLAAAVQYYETATNLRFRAGDALGEASSSNALGDVYRALGRPTAAVGAYRVALDIGDELAVKPVQLRAIDGLLAIYLAQAAWSDARAYLDRRTALTLNTAVSDAETLQTLIWLGEYHQLTGALPTAAEVYLQALELARSLELRSQSADLTNRLIELRAAGVL